MLPSGSFDPAELKFTESGAIPLVGFASATAFGGVLGLPVGKISSVMLCGGAVKPKAEPETLRSVSRLMAFAEVNW